MSSRAVTFALALAFLLFGCGAASDAPSARPPATHGATFTRTAGTLAAGACSQLQDRMFSLATGADGVVDLFVLVKTCAARAERDDVVLAVDAYSWLAVDRDFGAVSAREFVHVTLRAEVRLGSAIAYAKDHAEVTLTPRPGAKIAIEPVGILEVEALNWASLLALQRRRRRIGARVLRRRPRFRHPAPRSTRGPTCCRPTARRSRTRFRPLK